MTSSKCVVKVYHCYSCIVTVDKSRVLLYFLTCMIPERCCALSHSQHDERVSTLKISTFFLINQEESSGLRL